MTHKANVLLRWLVSVPSRQSPRGKQFSLPARFDHQGEDWTHDVWSLVIEVQGSPDPQGYQMASARFLAPGAPLDWLSVGNRFTLMEGRLPIATGEIRE